MLVAEATLFEPPNVFLYLKKKLDVERFGVTTTFRKMAHSLNALIE